MGVKIEKIIGHRGSGKTTKLLEFADKNGCVVVEPTYQQAVYASQMAIKNGLKCDVIPIGIFFKNLWHQSMLPNTRFVFDELDECLLQMGIIGYSNTEGPIPVFEVKNGEEDRFSYDPAKDADEEESHFCNSLNAEFGFIRHMVNDPVFRGVDYIPAEKAQLARLADYGERAQAVIMYLQKRLEEELKNGKKV